MLSVRLPENIHVTEFYFSTLSQLHCRMQQNSNLELSICLEKAGNKTDMGIFNKCFDVIRFFIQFCSYIIHPFKIYNLLGFKHNHRVMQSSPQSNFRMFSSLLKEMAYSIALTPHSSVPLFLATTNLLSSSMDYLFWAFQKNEIILCLAHCDWLLLLGVIFKTFKNFFLLYYQIIFFFMALSHFIHPIIVVWVFLLFGY